MVVYRDMTFCPFYAECDFGTACRRALTAEVIRRAANAGLDIAQFTEMPECYQEHKGELDDSMHETD